MNRRTINQMAAKAKPGKQNWIATCKNPQSPAKFIRTENGNGILVFSRKIGDVWEVLVMRVKPSGMESAHASGAQFDDFDTMAIRFNEAVDQGVKGFQDLVTSRPGGDTRYVCVIHDAAVTFGPGNRLDFVPTGYIPTTH